MQEYLGILEMLGKADGRLRGLDKTLQSTTSDPVVPQKFIERYQLRPGLELNVLLGKSNGKSGNERHQRGRYRGKRGKQRPKKERLTVHSSQFGVQETKTLNPKRCWA